MVNCWSTDFKVGSFSLLPILVQKHQDIRVHNQVHRRFQRYKTIIVPGLMHFLIILNKGGSIWSSTVVMKPFLESFLHHQKPLALHQMSTIIFSFSNLTLVNLHQLISYTNLLLPFKRSRRIHLTAKPQSAAA